MTACHQPMIGYKNISTTPPGYTAAAWHARVEQFITAITP